MEFLNYNNLQYGVSIDYPADWMVLEGFMGSVAALCSQEEDSKDKFRENLNIYIQDLTHNPLTLEQYTALTIEELEQLVTKFKIKSPPEESTRLRYPAQELIYEGRQGIFKLRWLSVYFIRDNKAYGLTCTGEKKHFDDYLSAFQHMLSSFQIL